MSETELPFILDGLQLQPRYLPLVPELQLMLLADDLPSHSLAEDDYHRLMQQPPYWAFCWGGGQALARWLLDHPDIVTGKRVVDFGAGSGVAGIAAARAGAVAVQAVDIDVDALEICSYNASLNGVDLAISPSYESDRHHLLLAADICYEETGFDAVIAHIRNGGQALIAESRKRNLPDFFPELRQIGSFQMRTFPDLEEASEFDVVHIFSTFIT